MVQLRVLDDLDDVLDLVFDLIDAFHIIKSLFNRFGIFDVKLVHFAERVLAEHEPDYIDARCHEEDRLDVLEQQWEEELGPGLLGRD